jgi:hypothetical protein
VALWTIDSAGHLVATGSVLVSKTISSEEQMMIADNMSGPAQFGLFALISAGVIAGLGDAYYTFLGFSVGLGEANPVARWLQKKLGNALSTFVAIAFFILVTAFLSVKTPTGAFVVAGAVTALETFNTFRNRSLYLKYRPQAKPVSTPVKK